MLSLRDAVKKHLKTRPFLEEALNEGLINISALSRMLKDDIEESLGEPINEGAIIMAIKRMDISVDLKVKHKLSSYLKSLGDTVVRSGLMDYTIKNSTTILKSQARFLSELSEGNVGFNAISRGVNETTIVISKSSEATLLKCFKDEVIEQKIEGLASITLQLPETNNQVCGVYYFLFKSLAEWGINVKEVISTTNEVSIIVSDSDIERTFSVLNRLKK